MNRHTLAALLAIILIGFLLRLYHLDTVAFRGDEAFSVQRWSAIPLTESLTKIAAIEPHPPLTYVLFRFWGLIFGTYSEFSLRMLPVLFNMIGIPAMYAIGLLLSKRRDLGLLAAFLWAIHPFEIWHAQDFRNYAIWAGLSALTLWLGLHILMANTRRAVDWVLYTLAALIACLIFYNELLTIGILGLYVLLFCWRNRALIVQWFLINAVIVVITSVAFLILQGNLLTSGGYGGTTGSFELVQYWQRFLPVLIFGDSLSITLIQQFGPYTVWWPLVLITIISMGVIVLYYQRRTAYFLTLLGFVPLIVLGIISTRFAIFRPRYVMMVVPAYILMASCAIVFLWRKNLVQRIVAFSLLIVWISLSAMSLNNYYHNPDYNKAPDWPALAQYLQDNTQANEIIIQTSVDAGFGYYYDRAEILAGEFALPADVDQPVPEIIDTMEQTATDYHSIWIVGQTFPDWPNAGVVENWAFENLQLVRETRIAGLPVRQFMDWNVLPTEIEDQALATYDDRIELVGIRIFPPEPENIITVWLYWRPRSLTETPRTVFVHLVGDINPVTGTPLWSQDDHPPQNGRVASDAWQTGVVYRDVFTLPLDGLVAGEYRIMTGLYDPQTNERMRLDDGTDVFTVGSITVEE